MATADLCEPADDGKVRCTACARYCEIGEGQTGLCGIRSVEDGKLQLDVYGRVITGQVDPIEKKPVTHHMPGTRIYSVATTGCNWLCRYCQNHDISQRREVEGKPMTPRQVVDEALAKGADGIAYTYNQPSIFMEFARDIGQIAREEGLINIFVSNGYDTPDGVEAMSTFLDCITVDFKGHGEPGFVAEYIGVPDPKPIYDTLERIRDTTDIHVEITDLVVPEVGDDEKACRDLCEFVHDELGPETPIHFLRFHPDYKMRDLPLTPVETLERCHGIARDVGLEYVYVGNVPGHPMEDTICSGCGETVVDREGYRIVGWNLETQPDGSNLCAHCGHEVPIHGELGEDAAQDRFGALRVL